MTLPTIALARNESSCTLAPNVRRALLGLVLLVTSSVCFATTSDVAAQAPPDIVKLRDGGMLRGWILESSPGEEVTIRLLDGSTRELEWSRVSYAGPESERPRISASTEGPTTTLETPPTEGDVTLRVRSADEHLTFHRITHVGSHERYIRLCAIPCELSLAPGRLHVAVSRGEEEPLWVPPVDLTSDGTLDVEYLDRSGVRTAGWAVFTVTLIGSIAALFGLLAVGEPMAGTAAALGGVGGGLVVSLPMIGLHDGAVIKLE